MLTRMVGRRLAFYRKIRGLTQNELAERVGVTDKHYGRVERGLSAPSFSLLEALSRELGVGAAHFFLFDEESEQPESQEREGRPAEVDAGRCSQTRPAAGTWLHNLEDKSHSWSDSLLMMLGCAPEHAFPSPRQFFEYVPKGFLPEVRDWLYRALKGEAIGELVFALRGRDGRKCRVTANADVFVNEADEPGTVAITICECGEGGRLAEVARTSMETVDELLEKRTSELRRELEHTRRELYLKRLALIDMEQNLRRLATVVAAGNDGYWEWDRKNGRVFISRRWKEILGYADSEIDDDLSEWSGRIHPDDFDMVMKAHEGLLNDPGRDRFRIEYRLRHKSGGYRWIRSSALAVRDEEGRLVRVSGADEDVTESVLLREELESKEQKLHAVMDLAPVALFVADAAGECTWVNEAWCRLTGLPRDEALGLGWVRTIHHEDRQRVVASWKAIVASGGVHEVEFRVVDRKENSAKRVYCKAVRVQVPKMNQPRFVGIVLELPEAHRSEEELRRWKRPFAGFFQEEGRESFQGGRALGPYLYMAPYFTGTMAGSAEGAPSGGSSRWNAGKERTSRKKWGE